MDSLEDLRIRTLKKEDLEAIFEIDEKVLGENRKDYWERKLEWMNDKSSQISVVADSNFFMPWDLPEGIGSQFRVEDLIPPRSISIDLRGRFGLSR